MSKAEKGSKVKVHYTGRLTNHTIFDSSRDREPLEFTVGAGQMIKGFDRAVEGMNIGDSKNIRIPMDEAYGPKRDDAFVTVNKSKLPEGLEPKVGMQLEASQPDGQRQMLVISEIKEDEVVLDANHPLAGQDLEFDIELMEVN
ncbi:peptidylprolyl isomerase [Mesonia sp. K7]|uniref:FKBP-type peptidyl-prolyl cis-trans isomerase n=1 Tax=Mesonia sp. K7 TaxID=2218606 RepID=UPI000DAA4885|nr:peptidylprolyl isomerase [Mesonia sp. K7]PZD79347.1 peptidylprolyl isomerase [Mesonia sp. K7]